MSESNFNLQQKEFLGFLKLLNDNDLLDKVIVGGSWAEYIYAQSGLLKGFTGDLRTLDVDFLIKNLRLPNTPTSLTALAAKAGYDIMSDILDETTKIVTPNGLEIEFLINQMGSGSTRIMKTNLGVNAQALRHMDITLRNSITVNLLGMNVTVPKPEAYVIHKMVINKDRTPAKQAKDTQSIYRLAPYLNQKVYQEVYDGLFKKEQNAVNTFIEKNGKLFEASIDEILADAQAAAREHNQSSGKNLSRDDFDITK